MHTCQTKEGLVSFCTSVRSLPQQFRILLASLLQSTGLPFADALSEEAIETAFEEEGVAFAQEDDGVYTPAITLWAFLSQMLFRQEPRSCAAAVARRRVADVPGTKALFRQYRRLLSRSGETAGTGAASPELRSGRRLRTGRARQLALEGPSHVLGGWLYGQHARYSRHQVQHGDGRVALEVPGNGPQGDLGGVSWPTT